MRRLALAIMATCLLTACADQPPLIDRIAKGRVEGDAEHASIAAGRLDALPLAIAHCARYGRSAQWSRSEGDRSVYACVSRP